MRGEAGAWCYNNKYSPYSEFPLPPSTRMEEQEQEQAKRSESKGPFTKVLLRGVETGLSQTREMLDTSDTSDTSDTLDT